MQFSKPIFLSCLVLPIVALGLLRYKPWAALTQANKDVIHEGPNNHAHRDLTIGFLPVTCHLTCPVTDYASKTTASNTNFNSRLFSDFPTITDALKSKQLMAAFMVAPLAMKMREQGVPVKICYLGHRDGSEIIVSKNSNIRSMADLKGRKMAIPSMFSNQHIVMTKLMMDYGLKPNDITFVVLPPPDMPTSLASGSIDAFFVGEPFCAKAEMDGYGRVLYYARDIWPNFISCVLVVHEDLIKHDPDVVRDLVRGIAQSGKWAETHRAEAAKLAAPYFRQDPRILNYVLTTNPPRVKYVDLAPNKQDLQQIQDIGIRMGILSKHIPMSDIVDDSFVPDHIADETLDLSKLSGTAPH